MYKLFELTCPNCSATIEELVEYSTDLQQPTEEILCEVCGVQMEIASLSWKPAYSKHGSWSEWNLDHRMGNKG